MRCPMIPSTLGVAILDGHTRLACLETNASCNAALGTADDDLVHPPNMTMGGFM